MFQISEVLKKVPFFQTLGRDGIDFIVERLKFKPFEEKELICKAGDPGDKMYIIISGKVKVVVTAEPGGEESVIAYLNNGDYFGEMALLTGEPRSASVITMEPSEMFILNKTDFDVIIERFPSISLSMGKIMSQRLRDTLQKAARKAPESMEQTVRGSLAEKKLVDVLKFSEANSLNGKIIVSHDEFTGAFYYEKGQLQKVSLANLPEDQALDTMLNWSEGSFIIEPRPIKMEGLKGKISEENSKSSRIIILNSSMVIQRLLQRAFESMGYEVYSVETAAKALNMIRSMAPNLILADSKLPDSNAVDFLLATRNITEAPVVFLTEKGSRAQFEAQTRVHSPVYFTNSQEVGEVVKVVEGAFEDIT